MKDITSLKMEVLEKSRVGASHYVRLGYNIIYDIGVSRNKLQRGSLAQLAELNTYIYEAHFPQVGWQME